MVPPGIALVEHRMLDHDSIVAAHAEADPLHDLVHDLRDVPLDGLGIALETHSLVSAADVETDARGRDSIPIGDDTTDGHCIPEVMISHECRTGRLGG